MPESPLLFSSVVPTCDFCLQVQPRGRGVKESRRWEADRRPHPSVRSLGRRWAIPGLPDSSISRPRNLASEPGGHDSEKHKNNTNEASMLLKTQGAFGKRTQNELNFERQMHRLNPNSELSCESGVRAGALRLEMRKGTEAIRPRKPGASPKKHKNNTNEASMSLKTHGVLGKRTQNELNFEHRLCGLRPRSELASISRVAPVGLFWGKRRALELTHGQKPENESTEIGGTKPRSH